MTVNKAVNYHLEYHKINSQHNTLRCVEFVLGKFDAQFRGRMLNSVSEEDVLSFLNELTYKRKQTTRRNRYSVLSSFYNFTTNVFYKRHQDYLETVNVVFLNLKWHAIY